MIEAEFWDYDSRDELADAVAGDIGFIIESALDARGDAVIAVPGGAAWLPVLEKLAKAKLPWKKVTIFPTDDRLVSVSDPLSQITPIARLFLPLGARVLPLGSENADHKAAGKAADARLQDLHWPPDLIWLAADDNANVAAMFPGPDLDEVLNGPRERRAVGVMPDPLPKDAPVGHVTLSKSAILSARSVLFTAWGETARAALEQAIEDGNDAATPIGRVLAGYDQPVDVHWAA